MRQRTRPWWNLDNPYTQRDDALRQMGFKSYRSYLKSALWADIRERAFSKHGRQCHGCQQPATVIHHRAYDRATLEGKSLDSLTPSCGKCHVKGERPALRQVARDRNERANLVTTMTYRREHLPEGTSKADRQHELQVWKILEKAHGIRQPPTRQSRIDKAQATSQRIQKQRQRRQRRKQHERQEMAKLREFVVSHQPPFDSTPKLIKRQS